ncbi:DUF1697 domain-containing protein [Reichenbachiella agarivorans]|uniref:DUF1697 domain-containing protein n=1 Tax=Reichenbachiella agarivorans TaxID=2979464 RepID=A0ABY6CTT2_9BACT|nr:DUF1697 domain-containing protein [Reichenbachiella agarivorans]UXP33927.1 DUF1697 domain-containing protein [Reichenbachiella agarivorans]
MKKYVALLRGINVSGQKKIKMTELKSALVAAGLTTVETYIQSGNLVFETELSEEESTQLIERVILEDFGFEVPTLVLEQSYFRFVLDNNPFLQRGEDNKKLYVCFMMDIPTEESKLTLAETDLKGDEYHIIDQLIYTCYHQGAGKTKMDNNLLERKLKVRATSRNWNTVGKLGEM